jgi:acetyl-CoA carboxylase biotin carboxyl carrier protein
VVLTFEQIKELIQLVRDGQLQGLEIEERSGQRVRITGRHAIPEGVQIVSAPAVPGPTLPTAGSGEVEAEGEIPSAEVSETAGEGGEEPEGHLLNSPIVGTFYSAPSPDSDAYAQIGDHVRKGQVLCIVEAMKLMNEIESDIDGTISKVYPKNAQPVEYGEALFLIEPD